jgi:hypothetical protein
MKTTKPLQRKTPLRATTIKASKRRPARPKMTPARANARGQDCTLQLPGCYPGPDNDQVQLCHLRMFCGGGTGLKPHDSEAVFGCTHCHDLIDGRDKNGLYLSEEFLWASVAWALIRTLRAQRESGILIFKGEN